MFPLFRSSTNCRLSGAYASLLRSSIRIHAAVGPVELRCWLWGFGPLLGNSTHLFFFNPN